MTTADKDISSRPVLLDARHKFDDGPIALRDVLGRPWLVTFLDTVADARAAERLTVLVVPEFSDEIHGIVAAYPGFENVPIVTVDPDFSDPLILNINQTYTRHSLIRVIRSGNGVVSEVSTGTLDAPSDMKIAEEVTIRETVGNRTALVHYFYRPLARKLVNLIAPTGITPNTITFLSLVIIPIAATLIVIDSYVMGVIAAGLLQLFFVMDVMDGVLARKLKRLSNFGYWLDTMVDNIHDSSLALAFTAGAIISSNSMWMTVPGAIWIVGMSATSSNSLIENAAGIETTPASVGMASPSNIRGSGLRSWLRSMARRVIWALGKPEIIIAIFGVGLVAGMEWAVVLFFALLNAYYLLRMFQLAYSRYRKNELSISNRG